MRQALAVCLGACLAAAACGRSETPAPESGRTDTGTASDRLREVPVPDLTGAEPALQERVRARYASLTAARENPDLSDVELANAYGEVGRLLIAAEFLGDAAPFLLNAQTLAPGEMMWPYYLGHVHRLRHERDRSIEAFAEALRLQPDYVPALVWLAAAHLDRGEAAEADRLFQQALGRQPRSAAARFGLARVALAQGDYARAREQLDAALAEDPGIARAHYLLATAHRGLGDERRAEAHLRRWEEGITPIESLGDGQIPPADPLMEEIGGLLQTAVAYETRGTRALDEGRWTEAIALFREGLAVAPRDATLHQNLGTALLLGGDAAGARAAFAEALRLSPGYARPHFSLGLLMDSSGRDAEAIARFRDAVRYDPQMTDARFSLGEALRRTGALEESLEHYAAVIAMDPSASPARFGRAMALVRLGRYAEARAALEEAVTVHPEQPGLPHALARVLAAAPDASVRDGRRALAIAEALYRQYGANAALLETMAMALAEVGRFQDAVARQGEAIAAAEQGSGPRPAMRDNLRRYQAGVPCRSPWPDDDPVHSPRATGITPLAN